jgi:hypothetical protein
LPQNEQRGLEALPPPLMALGDLVGHIALVIAPPFGLAGRGDLRSCVAPAAEIIAAAKASRRG